MAKKATLKERFGISNDDFDVVETLPPLTTQPPEAYVEKRRSGSLNALLLFSRPGLVAFISLAPAGLSELCGSPDIPTVILSDSEHESQSFVDTFPHKPIAAVTTPAPESTSRVLSPHEWNGLPSGSSLRLIFPCPLNPET